MASTVCELRFRAIVLTLAVVIGAHPASSHQEPCDAGTSCELGKENSTVRTNVTTSPYFESKEADYAENEADVSNKVVITSLNNEMETVTSESASTTARCSIEDTAAVNLGALLDAVEDATVTLLAEEPRLTAHRTILAACSPVFAAILCHGTQDASSSSCRNKMSTPATADRQPTTEAQRQSHSDRAQSPVAAAPHSWSIIKILSLPRCGHRPTPVATASPLPSCATPRPDEDAVSRFRVLSGDDRGRRLIEAAKAGAVAEVQALLVAGADVEARDDAEQTALHHAARGAHVEVAKRLLASRAEVNARSKWQCTPLHLAAKYGHAQVAQLLLASAADPNATEQEKWTPLHLAAKYGHAQVAQLLLASAADANATEWQMWTPLHLAARYGHAKVAQFLLASAADPDAKEWEGWTPLHLAAKYGHEKVTHFLLASHADPNAKEWEEWTPLHLAAKYGHAKVAQYLLASHADPNAREWEMWTPLHLAAKYGHAEVATALLRVGADDAATDDAQMTALDRARQHGQQALIDLLT